MVAGIELPPEGSEDVAVGLDAAVDAAVDATTDTALDLGPDVSPTDLGLDAQVEHDWGSDVEPVDMAVDLGPDAALFDPAELAGRWHLYGLSSAMGVFDVILVISAEGEAQLESFYNDGPPEIVFLDVLDPPLINLTLGPFSEWVEGVLDPISGAGVLVAPNATVFATRESAHRPEPLVDAGYFMHAFFPTEPGAGVFGVFGRLPDNSGFRESDGRTELEEVLAPQDFEASLLGERHFLIAQDNDSAQRILSPLQDAVGAIGLVTRAESTGLTMLWNSAHPQGLPESGRWFCGGVVRDSGQVVTRRRTATIDGSNLVWDEGGRASLERSGASVTLDAQSDPFFEHQPITTFHTPGSRLWALFDRQAGSHEIGWGLALCVRADLPY